MKTKPVLILLTDCHGEMPYQTAPMMRDELGMSQRKLAAQETRETMPRDVTPAVRPLVPAPKSPSGWIARLMARVWR